MAETALRREESLGLALAVIGHAALLAFLVFYNPALPPAGGEGRMSVTISDDAGAATNPDQSNTDLGDDSGPEAGGNSVAPQPVEQAVPQPLPKPTAKQPEKAQQAQTRTNAVSVNRAGKNGPCTAFDKSFGTCGGSKGSKPSNNLGGPKGGGTPNTGKGNTPATGQQKATWQNSIASRVVGPWQRCPVSGLDLEKLRVVIPFTLDLSGRVESFGEPRVSGRTLANQNQVEPFIRCAQRAIKLGAPYDLPPDYYAQWNSRELTFSKGRAQ